MLSDAEYDEKEKAFVDNMISVFSIPSAQKDEMLELLKEYANVYEKISNCIFQWEDGK